MAELLPVGGFGYATLFAVSILAVALLYIPGSLVLRLFGLGWARSLIAAPAISGAFYLVVALVSSAIGISWGWAPVLVSFLALAALLVFLQFRQRRTAANAGAERSLGIAPRSVLWTSGGLAVFLLVQIPALLQGMGQADMFPQIGDAQFHLQGARLVALSGDASPLSALSDIYPSDGNTYYPTLWHSLVVLLSFGHVGAGSLPNLILGTNALAIAVGLFMWPVSIATLAQVMSPKTPYVGAIAIMAATPLVLMPAIQVFAFGVYPFVLSLVLYPSALVLLVWLVRAPSMRLLAIYVLAAIGGAAAQPATGAFLVGALMVAGVVLTIGWSLKQARRGEPLLGLLATASAVGGFVAALLVAPKIGPLRTLGSLGHPSTTYTDAGLQLVAGNVYFIVERPFSGRPALILWAIILLILMVGLVRLARSAAGATLVTVAALAFGAYLLAAGPETYLRRLTAIWWKDQTRFALYLLVILLVAYAVGFAWLMRRLSEAASLPMLAPAVVGVWLVVAGVSAVPLNHLWLGEGRAQWIDRTYGGLTGGDFGLTEDHLAMLRSIDEKLTSKDVVVGPPADGTPWVNIMTDVGQYPLWKKETGPDEVYLRDNFDQIHSDPLVCEIVRDRGVTALLRSENAPASGDDPYRSYREVDVSDGFTLLASQGDVMLYRIDVCAVEQ